MQDNTVVELFVELQYLRSTLSNQFKKEQWVEMASTLSTLAKLGESQGHRELCLRAQSLQELMGQRAGGRGAAGKRVYDLYHDLLFHLSHLEWQSSSNRRVANHGRVS